MYINQKSKIPAQQKGKEYSVRVFFYLKNHHKFGLGYYDFVNNVWMDNDGVVLSDDFVWTYLPIKQMRAFLNATQDNEMY